MTNNLKEIFYGIPKGKDITLHFDTHYDANNYVFEKIKGKQLHRLDFQPLQNETIKVTHYIDKFKCCPKLLVWCHNNIPNFSYLAQIEYHPIGEFNIWVSWGSGL